MHVISAMSFQNENFLIDKIDTAVLQHVCVFSLTNTLAYIGIHWHALV